MPKHIAPVVYRRVPETEISTVTYGDVVPCAWADGIVFQCPCNFRTVYVKSPPHQISFEEDGRLTLVGSCGYRGRGKEGEKGYLAPNWCHFDMTGGVATMYGDATCPGSVLL